MATSPKLYARLPHAYGIATDAHEHLQLIISAESEANEKAWEYVYGAILHQGTPFPAAVPFLADLIEFVQTHPDHPAAPEIAEFIAGIAEAITGARMTMGALRLSAPSDFEERLFALAWQEADDENDFWDAALSWTLLHCAQQIPQAILALQIVKDQTDYMASKSAVEALDELDAATAVLNGQDLETN